MKPFLTFSLLLSATLSNAQAQQVDLKPGETAHIRCLRTGFAGDRVPVLNGALVSCQTVCRVRISGTTGYILIHGMIEHQEDFFGSSTMEERIRTMDTIAQRFLDNGRCQVIRREY